jgi:ATP-dependent Clp protease ATP-binding subunit ClpA
MFERFTSPARAAVTGAAEQARLLRSREIGAEHLLLALIAQREPVLVAAGYEYDAAREQVRSAMDEGPDDAEALAAIGIDLPAIQDAVATNIGPDAWAEAAGDPRRRLFGRRLREPLDKAARKALELALREAIARGDRSIGSEHLLLGLTRDPQGIVRAVLEKRLPIPVLRDRIRAALDEAA